MILEVPQGSIIDPILFIIYTNDIPQSVDRVGQPFADDTQLYRVISGAQDQEALQCDINNLCTWSDKWSLRFNTKKCKMIQYGNKSIQLRILMVRTLNLKLQIQKHTLVFTLPVV